jgi:RNA polymerase sigma-70 factor (ECF subfamily)
VDEEEMIATLMARLLVAEPGRNPRLSQYAGRSELRRWLQVAATRHILYAKRRPARSAPLEETMLAEVLAAAVPEWGNADVASRQAFKEALGRALKSLGKRDRSLLRLRLEGLNTIAIGKIFRVDRRQVSRWLGRVNVAIEQEVRRELRESMRLTSQDLDSLVRSVLSRVDTSIRFQVSSAIQDDK